jgi:D-3-phosphoglycerate dehydrogenase
MNENAFKVVAQKLPARCIPVFGEGFAIEEKILNAAGAKLLVIDTDSEDRYLEAAKDADALLVYAGGLQVGRKTIQSLERCKIIAVAAVGYDNVDIGAARDRNLWVTNVPDVFIEEVADHTLTLLLSAWRRLTVQDRMVRTGRWSEARPMLNRIPRLMGQTLGFISFGNVPKSVSRRAKAFGFHMMAYDPYISELTMFEHGVEPVTELSELLARSDFVSAHLPLSAETRHMLSEAQFRRMKPSAVFINTGRGATVDERALVKALKEGWIAGAALDVFETEPVEAANPLLAMENVILTAHAASASSRMPPETRRRAANEIVRVLKGGSPIFPVVRPR